MSTEQKLAYVKTMLFGAEATDTSEDATLTAYLSMAEKEIIAWKFGYGTTPISGITLPEDLEMTQVQAVVNGYSIRGAEGQILHNENAIYRTFKYEDMVTWIHAHVIPIAKVM